MTRHDTVPPVLFLPALTEADQLPVCATADSRDTATAGLRDPFRTAPEPPPPSRPATRALT